MKSVIWIMKTPMICCMILSLSVKLFKQSFLNISQYASTNYIYIIFFSYCPAINMCTFVSFPKPVSIVVCCSVTALHLELPCKRAKQQGMLNYNPPANFPMWSNNKCRTRQFLQHWKSTCLINFNPIIFLDFVFKWNLS